jgi:hypothetical protein
MLRWIFGGCCIQNMFEVAEGLLKQAEALVGNVVEIDTKLTDALEAEVSLVTGNKASIQLKILAPSQMFRNLSGYKFETLKDKLFLQITSSRLSLDFCGVIYNSLIVFKRAHAHSSETAKHAVFG